MLLLATFMRPVNILHWQQTLAVARKYRPYSTFTPTTSSTEAASAHTPSSPRATSTRSSTRSDSSSQAKVIRAVRLGTRTGVSHFRGWSRPLHEEDTALNTIRRLCDRLGKSGDAGGLEATVVGPSSP